MLLMKHCPKCNCELGENLQQGQEITCPNCGFNVEIHYTLSEQIHDPVGLLFRDKKYISNKYRILFLLSLIVFIVFMLSLLK